MQVSDPALLQECQAFLNYVVTYIEQEGACIRPGETLLYGYWVTKFETGKDEFLEVWESKPDNTGFVPGATLTLTYWRDQKEVCANAEADFAPPRPDQLVVVSAGVFEGDSVEGVRYPTTGNMSGWWITTDRYNGDIKTLHCEHLYHLTAARPDLARYLALPYGFCFDFLEGERVYFDPEVANEPPV